MKSLMKNFVLASIVFLIWAIFGMWYYSCIINNLCLENDLLQVEIPKLVDTQAQQKRAKDSIAADSIAKIKALASIVKQKEDSLVKSLFSSRDFKVVNYVTRDTIAYYTYPVTVYKNKSKVYLPEQNRTVYTTLAETLNKNNNFQIIVYGPYNASIEQDSLGIQRAQNFKNKLIRFGVNKNKVETYSKEIPLTFDSKGRSFYGLVVLLK